MSGIGRRGDEGRGVVPGSEVGAEGEREKKRGLSVSRSAAVCREALVANAGLAANGWTREVTVRRGLLQSSATLPIDPVSC